MKGFAQAGELHYTYMTDKRVATGGRPTPTKLNRTN